LQGKYYIGKQVWSCDNVLIMLTTP